MHLQERPFNPSEALKLTRQGLSPTLAKLFAARGISDYHSEHAGLSALIGYDELKSAMAMAEVLADAIEAGKRLLILADYDADGATACSVGLLALKAFGANVGYLIPDRAKHGYGLSRAIAEIACAQAPKPDFIITVDNGIASADGINCCNEHGVPVLVTDHHLPGGTLPAAKLIVNPNQPGCGFPSKAMAGVGVMYYVMWALQDELMERGVSTAQPNFDVTQLLPIVAIGTVADVVKLDRNNRILVREGLKRIRAGCPWPGVNALAQLSVKNLSEVSTSDIAFGIGPRINAAGRLQHMSMGVECLTTSDAALAADYAQQLDAINKERKSIEGDISEQALGQLLSDLKQDRHSAVLYSSTWHQGVIGIVASRIKERIWRPTFVMAKDDTGGYKGSGRSIPGFHLRDALDRIDRAHPGLLLKFGGHAMAAGVTVREDGLDTFREAFEVVAQELLKPEDLLQILQTDGPLENSEMCLETAQSIASEVWGQAFPEPVFCDSFKVVSQTLTRDGKHLRMTLEKNGRMFNAVKFRYAGGPLKPTARVAYKLDINEYKDEKSLQLLVEDIQS